MCVIDSGLSCICFNDHNSSICIVYYRVPVSFYVADYRVAGSTTTNMRPMERAIVYRFKGVQLCVLCTELTCISLIDYHRSAFSTTTNVYSL